MTIATIAANVAAALAGVTTATDIASTVKFTAVVDFAATTAIRLRVEHINTGSNLETDAKGRLKALVDISKEQRAALVTALQGAGVQEKDAANIASMGRTVALFFVPLMVQDGSIRTAASGDRMAEIIRESLLTVTGQAATYNAIEKARARKWEVAPEEAEEVATDAAPATETDMGATLDNAPEPDAPEPDAPKADDVLTEEVRSAFRILNAALERDDVERLIANGLRPFLSAALEASQKAERENAAAEKAMKAA